ncbi:serine/threonine-protein kinase [Adlercreutzia sp. ZJ242]|uniref:serine/threonine-protein kinase n=1 Tax=Adlercreutzia sp. ZJ242 TaxID=2709409 RepID=UPI0013ECFB37|nr:serine/threonine-protein kinase [Adlercreutzia sp. ZJ242]
MARTQLILDRYRVIGKAGAGGYGTVQHAYDTHLKRDVAIKCIELSEADVARAHLLAMEERLQREAEERAAREAEERAARAELDAAPAREPLPWEDDFEIPDSPDFPEEPAFLRRRAGAGAGTGAGAGEAGAHDVGVASADAGPGANVVGASAPSTPFDSFDSFDDPDDLDADDLFDHIPGLAEAQTVAKLNDANIVTVYDCAVEGATAYIIMEYVEGKTLARIMREMGDDISLDVIAAVFSSVAHALEFAHDADVLHLDVKPENVIVNTKGVVKVTDFGLATLMDASGQGTAGGGTIGYMPLEQMRQEALDVRTDEWALASLTYEMLSGANPFSAPGLAEAEEAIEEAELVLPSLCWDALDAAADDIMFTALDPDPDERYESVAAFADELTPLLGNARAGKRALAAIVREEEPDVPPEPEAPREPLPPLVDRLGPTGAAVIARVLAVASVVMVSAVALVNMRFGGAGLFGVASDLPVAFWAVLAALAALTAWRPAFGALAAYLCFAAMLLLNFAFVPGLLLLAAAVTWWWFVGRFGSGPAVCALLQPLCGSVGLGALSAVAAGAVLDVREAAATAAFSALAAIAFASLGSCDLMSWDILANALVPASAQIAGASVANAFVDVVATPLTWCVAVSWIAAATLFSLFCMRGTRAFDIAGACVAAAALVVGAVAGAALAAGMGVGAGSAGAAASAGLAAGFPSPLALVGTLVPGAVGIVLAVASLCDRVRLEEGEW